LSIVERRRKRVLRSQPVVCDEGGDVSSRDHLPDEVSKRASTAVGEHAAMQVQHRGLFPMSGRHTPDPGHTSDTRLGVVDKVSGWHLLEECVERSPRDCDRIGRKPGSERLGCVPVDFRQSVMHYCH
jgi:hypothetical protein